MDWSGSWTRPYRYGDPAQEYRAVREHVSLMDVGTLGKFLVGGRDAVELLDRVLPCRVRDLAPGRSRYLLALDEAGYVVKRVSLDELKDGNGIELIIANASSPRAVAPLVRSLRTAHSAPVLLISARFRRGQGESATLAEQLGVHAVLAKPFTRDELLEAVARATADR
jgi:glycine cleavage system aminomethyltransferase T